MSKNDVDLTVKQWQNRVKKKDEHIWHLEAQLRSLEERIARSERVLEALSVLLAEAEVARPIE